MSFRITLFVLTKSKRAIASANNFYSFRDRYTMQEAHLRRHRISNSMLLIIAFWLSLFWGSSTYADSFTFSTLPASGNVSGPAGSTVGWGYTITNQSATDWLATTALNADAFLKGSPSNIFDFPILAPMATVSVAFDAIDSLGLYSFTWDSIVPSGFINSGNFVLSAEWWDGDPFAGGNFISAAVDQAAPYSATVTSVSAVPEPSTLVLLLCSLITVWLWRTNSRWRLSRAPRKVPGHEPTTVQRV